jgi:hypothetical protein
MSKILINLLKQMKEDGASPDEINEAKLEGEGIIVEVKDLQRWGQLVDEMNKAKEKSFKGGPERGH